MERESVYKNILQEVNKGFGTLVEQRRQLEKSVSSTYPLNEEIIDGYLIYDMVYGLSPKEVSEETGIPADVVSKRFKSCCGKSYREVMEETKLLRDEVFTDYHRALDMLSKQLKIIEQGDSHEARYRRILRKEDYQFFNKVMSEDVRYKIEEYYKNRGKW